MEKKFIIVTLLVGLLISCGKNGTDFETIQKEKIAPLSAQTILTYKADSSYFYDIQLINGHIFLLDDQNDTVLRMYNASFDSGLQGYIIRSREREGLWAPAFTKEVQLPNQEKPIILVDQSYRFKEIFHTKNGIACKQIQMNKEISSSYNFNLTDTFLYASSRFTGNKAFFYYQLDSGFYNVYQDTRLDTILPHADYAGTNNLCVNEAGNRVAVSYRYTNYLSFYELDGDLLKTIRIGNQNIKATVKQNEINTPVSTKCFIDMYGTAKYLYCAYSGSLDFSTNTKIHVFNWEGKYIKTLQLDSPIRKFCVDPNDQRLIAIIRDPNKGQRIIQYNLDASL